MHRRAPPRHLPSSPDSPPFSGASQRGRLWPMSATDSADHRSAPTFNTRRRLAQTAPVPSRRTMLLLSTIAAGALAGCSIWKRDIGGTVLKSDQARTELTPGGGAGPEVAAVSACDALGAALLSAQLADGAHANALASPASLALNLAAASLGATDPEAQGLNKLLGAADEEARNTTWSAIQTALLAHDGDVSGFKPDKKAPEHPLVHVADQIVIIDHDEPTEVSQDFIDNVRYWFSADLRRADVDKAQDVLNEWVKQNTAGLIESSALDATTIDLALQNVVLFAAQWKELFDKKSTQDEDFTCADGSVIRVPMMRQQSSMVCTEGTTGSVTWKVLRVPYAEDFALDIVLPDKGTLPEELPSSTWAAASALLDQAESEGLSPEVSLWLPRIDLATRTEASTSSRSWRPWAPTSARWRASTLFSRRRTTGSRSGSSCARTARSQPPSPSTAMSPWQPWTSAPSRTSSSITPTPCGCGTCPPASPCSKRSSTTRPNAEIGPVPPRDRSHSAPRSVYRPPRHDGAP